MAADVNTAVQAAIGGLAPTQILQATAASILSSVISRIPTHAGGDSQTSLLPTPDGNRVPLGQVADVSLHEGAFMIYRENGSVTFQSSSACAAAISPERFRTCKRASTPVHLAEGYHIEWAGEYDSLLKEQRRLAIVIPLSLLVIFGLLFTAFNSLRHAVLVLAMLPFGLTGGVLSLLVTHTPFSISAAVGFAL